MPCLNNPVPARGPALPALIPVLIALGLAARGDEEPDPRFRAGDALSGAEVLLFGDGGVSGWDGGPAAKDALNEACELAAAPAPGEPGAPCEEGPDCDSGCCVRTAAGKV